MFERGDAGRIWRLLQEYRIQSEYGAAAGAELPVGKVHEDGGCWIGVEVSDVSWRGGGCLGLVLRFILRFRAKSLPGISVGRSRKRFAKSNMDLFWRHLDIRIEKGSGEASTCLVRTHTKGVSGFFFWRLPCFSC